MFHANLRASGNPDRGQYCGAGILAPNTKIEGQSIEDMTSQFRSWVEENDLGAGNVGKVVVFDGRKKAGEISYNGRFWPVEVK